MFILECAFFFIFILVFFLSIFYWLCYYSCLIFFSSFSPSTLQQPLPPAFPHLSSCPWVLCISSLASPSPVLFFFCVCVCLIYFLLLFHKLLYYCSTTVVYIFSPPLPPIPAKPTSLPCFHPPPWFCPGTTIKDTIHSLNVPKSRFHPGLT